MKNNRHKIVGFTLIELLVVISIIALLISIILPALSAVKDRVKDGVCLNNLKQIGTAVMVYANEYDQLIPRNAGGAMWPIVFAPYLGQPLGDQNDYMEMEIYNCPKYPDKEQTIDYIMSNWNENEGGGAIGKFSNITAYKNSGVKIYMADYASKVYEDENGVENTRPHVKLVRNVDDFIQHKNYMDVCLPLQLPSWPDMKFQRVSGVRHKKNGCNNLFFDGHAEWKVGEDNIPRFWTLK